MYRYSTLPQTTIYGGANDDDDDDEGDKENDDDCVEVEPRFTLGRSAVMPMWGRIEPTAFASSI